MESTSQGVPIACSLSLKDLAGRTRRWLSLAQRALIGMADTDEGLRLSFGAVPGAEAELRDLAGLEQECCGFASWTVHAADEAVVLDVAGASPEAAAAVREMLAGLRTNWLRHR